MKKSKLKKKLRQKKVFIKEMKKLFIEYGAKIKSLIKENDKLKQIK